jgi:hypothetical protein
MSLVACGGIGSGEEVAVNFPLPLFLAENEQFIVRLFDFYLSSENIGLHVPLSA